MNLIKIPFITLLFYQVCVQVEPWFSNSEVVWKVKVVLYANITWCIYKSKHRKMRTEPWLMRWCRVNRDSISLLKTTRMEIYISSYPCKDFAPQLSLYWLNYSTECISYMSFFSSVWTWVSIKKAARPAGSLLGFPAGSFIFHTLKYPILRHHIKSAYK